jgi:hypothetical protein
MMQKLVVIQESRRGEDQRESSKSQSSKSSLYTPNKAVSSPSIHHESATSSLSFRIPHKSEKGYAFPKVFWCRSLKKSSESALEQQAPPMTHLNWLPRVDNILLLLIRISAGEMYRIDSTMLHDVSDAFGKFSKFHSSRIDYENVCVRPCYERL